MVMVHGDEIIMCVLGFLQIRCKWQQPYRALQCFGFHGTHRPPAVASFLSEQIHG